MTTITTEHVPAPDPGEVSTGAVIIDGTMVAATYRDADAEPGPDSTEAEGDVQPDPVPADDPLTAPLPARAKAKRPARAKKAPPFQPAEGDESEDTVIDSPPEHDGIGVMMELDRISPSPDNLRQDLGDLTELTASVRASGVLEPLLVRPTGEKRAGLALYEIVAGHRRYAAAQAAGLDRLFIVIRELTDDQRDEAMLIENLQRRDLDILEEARGYFRLAERGMTIRTLARRIGRPVSHVSTRLSLLQLPKEALKLVEEDKLDWDGMNAFLLAERENAPAAIRKEMLDSAKKGWRFDHIVRNWKAKKDADAAIAKIEAVAEKAGWAVQLISYEVPRGRAIIKDGQRDGSPRIGYNDPVIDVPMDAHQKEPCHVLLIRNTGGGGKGIGYLQGCNDPKRHKATAKGKNASPVKAPAESESPAEVKRKEREREQRAAQAAQAARTIERRVTVSQRIKQADLNNLLAYALLASLSAEQRQSAVEFAGVDVIIRPKVDPYTRRPVMNKKGDKQLTEKDYDGTLLAMVESGGQQRRTALAACSQAAVQWGAMAGAARLVREEVARQAALWAPVEDGEEDTLAVEDRIPEHVSDVDDDPDPSDADEDLDEDEQPRDLDYDEDEG